MEITVEQIWSTTLWRFCSGASISYVSIVSLAFNLISEEKLKYFDIARRKDTHIYWLCFRTNIEYFYILHDAPNVRHMSIWPRIINTCIELREVYSMQINVRSSNNAFRLNVVMSPCVYVKLLHGYELIVQQLSLPLTAICSAFCDEIFIFTNILLVTLRWQNDGRTNIFVH